MQLVPRRELEDWFFRQAKPERHELESRARAEVIEWRWFKGIGNPMDPEPMRWQRAGIPLARLVKQVPAKDARAGHHEVGLDRSGRPWISYQHAVTERPYLTIWLHEPGWIRGVRYGTNIEYDFSGPEVVTLFELDDEGRVIGKSSYANQQLWPEDRALNEEDIERLRNSKQHVFFSRERYHWDGERLIAADRRSADDGEWIPTTEIEWPTEKRKAPKIWTLAGGKRELRKPRG